jgi:hypothetical protein
LLEGGHIGQWSGLLVRLTHETPSLAGLRVKSKSFVQYAGQRHILLAFSIATNNTEYKVLRRLEGFPENINRFKIGRLTRIHLRGG